MTVATPLTLSHNPGLSDAVTVTALLLIPTLVLLAGCREKHPMRLSRANSSQSTVVPPSPSGAPCAALDGLLLPAGLHFRQHTFNTCTKPSRCAAPKAAVLVGVARTAAGAERRTAQAEQVRPALPPGYPLVVHTDELGLDDATLDGVAVVAGLFLTAADAHRWKGACATLHPTARVLPLATSGEALTRLPTGMLRRHYVTRISAGPPVPAYAEQDLEQLHPVAGAPRVAPMCTLKPGRLFIFNTRHVRWYKWAPVRCGNRKAYVRWTSSLLASTVMRRPHGKTLLRQVTRVVCEHPQLSTWRYDNTGRRQLPPRR